MTAHLGFSQADYPKSRLIDKDTVAVFSRVQVDQMNVTFVALDSCKEQFDTLYSEMKLLQEKDAEWKIIKAEFEYQIKNLKTQNQERGGQIGILTIENATLTNKNKVLKKLIKWLIPAGVAGGAVGAYLLIIN